MPIRVQCSSCGNTASLPDSAAGKSVRCKCGASFPATPTDNFNGMVIVDEARSPVPTSAVLRCDSCHASLKSGVTKCEYCGQESVILYRGTRLGDLLTMYLEAGQYQEAQDVSSDILKEHPQNALAWASKGLSALYLEPRTSVDEELKGTIKCFEMARKFSPTGELIADLRMRAAQRCLDQAQGWARKWMSDPISRPTRAMRYSRTRRTLSPLSTSGDFALKNLSRRRESLL